MEKSVFTLTNAQIKSLPTEPVVLLPAPGVGKANFPQLAFLFTSFGAGAYTNIQNEAYLKIAPAGLDNGSVALISRYDAEGLSELTVFGDTPRRVFPLPLYTWGGASYQSGFGPIPAYDLLSDIENLPVTISIINSGGNLLGGHPSNTLKGIVYYTIEEF